MKIITTLILIALTGFTSLQGQDYALFGYTKYMFSSTRYPGMQNRLNDHLVHSRINTRWYPGDALSAAMEIRFRAIAGDSPGDYPDFKGSIQSNYAFMDLDGFLWEEKNTLGYGEIDRLHVDYIHGNLQMTLGRQRIAWGTTLVWNLTDLFNPMSILDFDYEEKPGVDALRLQYFTGPVSRMELVFKPGKDMYETTIAALWSTNAFAYDFFLLSALRNHRWVLGGAWAGDVKGGGFRGEVTYSAPPSEGPGNSRAPLKGTNDPFQQEKDPVLSTSISADYTFSNSFYVHSEILHNSNGLTGNAGVFQSEALNAGLLSPARWSLFQEFAYDITPLIRSSLFTIYNPDDGSSITVPMLDWSVKTNWDVTLVAFLTNGKARSEYGGYGEGLFARVKFSF